MQITGENRLEDECDSSSAHHGKDREDARAVMKFVETPEIQTVHHCEKKWNVRVLQKRDVLKQKL